MKKLSMALVMIFAILLCSGCNSDSSVKAKITKVLETTYSIQLRNEDGTGDADILNEYLDSLKKLGEENFASSYSTVPSDIAGSLVFLTGDIDKLSIKLSDVNFTTSEKLLDNNTKYSYTAKVTCKFLDGAEKILDVNGTAFANAKNELNDCRLDDNSTSLIMDCKK